MLIFGIETSCDETSASFVRDGVEEIATVTASSADLHQKTGGIVPEVASRKQVEFIVPVIQEVFEKAGKKLNLSSPDDVVRLVDAVSVTYGPGLIGSLLVGVEAAKTLSLVWDKPLIPVNHLIGHIYGNWVNNQNPPELPAIVLVVSGGHTDLVLMKDHGVYEFLGSTHDDAVGESFDKTARLLGIGSYLGGAQLSKIASTYEGDSLSGLLPRPMINEDNFDFSFSGLKTAVRRLAEKKELPVAAVAREFEDAVVDVLVSKTIKAARKYDVRGIILAGGVSANKHLQKKMTEEAKGMDVHFPFSQYTGDTASYIASAAFFNYKEVPVEKVKANPPLSIMD